MIPSPLVQRNARRLRRLRIIHIAVIIVSSAALVAFLTGHERIAVAGIVLAVLLLAVSAEAFRGASISSREYRS